MQAGRRRAAGKVKQKAGTAESAWTSPLFLEFLKKGLPYGMRQSSNLPCWCSGRQHFDAIWRQNCFCRQKRKDKFIAVVSVAVTLFFAFFVMIYAITKEKIAIDKTLKHWLSLVE